MPFIAGYLLKLSLSLSVVYLFYILVLRRLTFYTWNRWYLLGYSLLAFLIPFVNISPVLQEGEWEKNMLVQLIPMFAKLDMAGQPTLHEPGFAGWSYLLAGASIGILLMMVRFLVRYISYRRIRRSAQLLADDGVKLYHVDKSIIPFSFGNAIFINRRLHAEEDLREIIHHEFIHVKQKHTIDILWGELLCMLNWYNPFAWLIRKAIRQNLEFIADHKVLENGIDKKHYQYLLLKVTGAAHFSITQQFNFSSLKKRIIMMNRSRSATIQLTRFLFLLPLLTILLLAFRSNVIENARVHDMTGTAPPDISDFIDEKMISLTDTIPLDEKKRPAKNILKENITLISDSIVLRDTARKVFPDASLDTAGNPRIKLADEKVLIIVDGVKIKGISTLDIKPENIQQINVLKDESARQKYGDAVKDKMGVIEIETKDHASGLQFTAREALVTQDSTVFTRDPAITFRGNGNALSALYIVDDVELSREEFEKLDVKPERIESVSVLKGEAATRQYGKKGRDGVIIIKLKKPITRINLRRDSVKTVSIMLTEGRNPQSKW